MHAIKCNKLDLADFLAGHLNNNRGNTLLRSEIFDLRPEADGAVLLWNKAPTDRMQLPNAVIVEDDQIRNFFAWTHTYYRKIRPFSAMCRVLTPSTLIIASECTPPFRKTALQNAAMGLIIAEGTAYSFGRAPTDRIGYAALSRTLSYLFADLVGKYGQIVAEKPSILEYLADKWEAARMAVGQRQLTPSAASICYIWTHLIQAYATNSHKRQSNTSDVILTCLKEIRDQPENQKLIFKILENHLISAAEMTSLMSGPIEGRVKTSIERLHLLAKGPDHDRPLRSFLAGYLISCIQPGTFDHIAVLDSVAGSIPECVLWYGVCAGILSGEAINAFSNGAGIIVGRELERETHWLDRPSCDLSFDELEVTLRGSDNHRSAIKTMATGVINIEFFPVVNSNVKWTELGDEKHSIGHQSTEYKQESMFKSEISESSIHELSRCIDDNYHTIIELKRRMDSLLGDSNTKSRRRRTY